MTNLLIAYPDIPQRAQGISHSLTFTDIHNIHNLRSGERYMLGQLLTPVTGTNAILYDLGTGNTSTCNYLVIARADLLAASNCTTVNIKANTVNNLGTATTICTTSLTPLYGTLSDDYYTTFATSSAYRFWWVEYTVSSSSTIPHSKTYFGNAFDLGMDPSDIQLTRIEPRQNKYFTDSGAAVFGKQEQSKYKISAKWEGLSDDTIRDFHTKISATQYRKNGLFLLTTTDFTVLDNKRVLHVELTETPDSTSIKTDYNTLTCSFVELVG